MSAPDWPRTLLDDEIRADLLGLACASIAHGLATGAPVPAPDDVAALLREPGACFVTLRRRGALRGCIGEIGAWRPLAESVADRAFASAFDDPRFPPLTAHELEDLELHISVQGPLEPLHAVDERDLIRQLRPAVDGLVLRCGPASATFLPAVWESLPEPARFVAELKRKAGLAATAWHPDFEFARYEVVEISGRFSP